MENIDKVMEKFGLGLSRDGSVLLLDHQSGWDDAFIFESQRIRDVFKELKITIHHVGSTSISSISAKPILDLLGEVSSVDVLDSQKSLLEALGYEYKGEYGIPGRRFCVLYNKDKSKSYVHLHIFNFGDVEVKKHLVFRDYLCAFPNIARAYEDLKKDLSARLARPVYTEAKNEFIQKTLKDAYEWNSLS